MTRTTATMLTALLLGLQPLFAQRATGHELKWTAQPERSSQAQLWFEGAFPHEAHPSIPLFHLRAGLPAGVTAFSVDVIQAQYGALSAAEAALLEPLGDLGPEVSVSTALSWYRKQPVGLVTLIPFRRNPVTGALERLLSFELNIQPGKGSVAGRPKSGVYPDHSKLATGEWYRISVPREGVYRITGGYLQQMGVNLGTLASDQLNIYGSQTGQLPFRNADMPPTDLEALAIAVNDGGDGQFGSEDELLFYANGPNRWDLRANGLFSHVKNVYCDSAYYFIGIGTDPPRRVMDGGVSPAPATHTVTTFNEHQVIDRDLVNLVKSGRQFFGEVYDLVKQYNYSFSVPFIRCDAPVTLVMDVAARTIGSSTSSFTYNVASGLLTNTVSINGIGISYTGYYARPRRDSLVFNCPPATIPITVTFNPADPVTSVGYMNAMELNARRDLRFIGDQLGFRDVSSVGVGNVAEFVLENAAQVHRIWDLTDPLNVRNVPFTVSGTNKTFRVAADSLRQYIAFRNTNYPVPAAVGRVANQDLHATVPPVDLIIICPPEFQGQAMRLANQRASDGLNVVMVSPQQVYNEYSSGTRDASAIKRYMKMLYDRAGTDPALMPRYLLLFGDGSYNNFISSISNQNWVPTYQSLESLDLSRSYTSDDYFGLLDDLEGEATSELVDIGIGRLPVSSLLQATQAVDKILAYDRLGLMTSTDQTCAGSGDGGANDWRTLVVFASDDQEGDNFEGPIHMLQSDQLATRVENEHPRFNVSKIYLDAYRQITNLGVERYPEAEEDLRQRVQKGALLVNYIGHGGEVGWAHERFLNNSTILGWTNRDRLPLFMTATCEFTRWDDPARTSAGEYVFLNPSGGGIGLMTTTRLAYSFQNYTLAGFFYDHVFEDLDEQGRVALLGDVCRRTKIGITTAQPGQTNHRSFSLIGDPSMRLAMPRQEVVITAITDTLGQAVDTLRALAVVRITGHVLAPDGSVDTGFSGVVIPTVFDKRVTQSTLANDGGSPFNYSVRKNVIYKGKVSAVNGLFSLTFVVPKDIAYQVGPGRVSVYAEGFATNACGFSNDILVGDTDPNAALDEEGPRIDLYLNDERFVRGGITNESPMIFAKLFDVNGINTVGNSIGHDLLAILDENTDQALVLNDYYESDLDTYQSGKVRYRMQNLKEGSHTLSLKAWDVHNNSSTSVTEFVVASSEEMALAHVLNYPNPFTTNTSFFFEHNRPCSTLEVQVQVFTVSGRLVKTINRRLTCEGFRAEPMAWDGLDDRGDKLGRGVYVYRLHVTASDGSKAEKYEKLVILR